MKPAKLAAAKDVSTPDIFFCLSRIPDSERLIVGSSDGKIYELDLSAEKPAPAAFGDGGA